ncbi:MAG TPA: GNAT family N-acetyltransferase [Candidatus Sulfotelmatobacter sp.]|nr:GNAT family N-acetyltransferase [Candidatus Sulfotelmatobacter sp.]
MYMLWPQGRAEPDIPSIPKAYSLSMIVSEDIDKTRSVIEIDGPLSDSGWSWFRNAVVPDGMFVIQERASSAWVGIISAVHNPAATRFYFPGGGELGYLVVAPEHRRRRLGAALIAAAVRRLHQGGYRHIFLGVQSWRLPAIQSYLRAGFQPFIHAPELVPRWQRVFAALGQEARETKWPTSLVGLPPPIRPSMSS